MVKLRKTIEVEIPSDFLTRNTCVYLDDKLFVRKCPHIRTEVLRDSDGYEDETHYCLFFEKQTTGLETIKKNEQVDCEFPVRLPECKNIKPIPEGQK